MYTKSKIHSLLRRLGLNNSYLGFFYLTYAIQLVIEDESRLIYISKWLYPDIAKKYNTSVSCVERDIRTAIDVIWKHGDRELLAKMSTTTLELKPKNTKFIAILANHFKTEYSNMVL